jgi:seryl-tRNA synthetase
MSRPIRLSRGVLLPRHCLRFTSSSASQTNAASRLTRFPINQLVENQAGIRRNCIARNIPSLAESIHEIGTFNDLRLEFLAAQSTLRARRNVISALLGKTTNKNLRNDLLTEASAIKAQLSQVEEAAEVNNERGLKILEALPNDMRPGTPPVETEVGTIGRLREKKVVKDHVEIAESLDLLDLLAGARTTGHAWYYLKGMAVQLELALVSYAIEMAMKRGWKLVKPPDVVRMDVALACGFRPRDKDGDQIYRLSNVTVDESGTSVEDGHLCLAGTAEIPLAAMNMERTFEEKDLPIKYVGVGTAYRAEAGSRGRESKGLYRVHQFTKVELFAWTRSQDSDEMLNEILVLQKEIVESLGLHARILDMPAHELGNAAYAKYDIEAWLYGRQAWGEITSASNCTDYQSRRLNTRYRPVGKDAKLQFVHTLNGTAMAVPRMIIAILESGFQEDGTIEIPMALRKFIGEDTIGRN